MPQTQYSHNVDLTPIRGAKILLVEDNVINQELAKRILAFEGFDVDVADNGKDAVERVAEQGARAALHLDDPYDLVLMDLKMPVMDGYEASEKIRGLAAEIKDVPIIAMTAHTSVADPDTPSTRHFDGYVFKPIDQEKLFTTLTRWIRPKGMATRPPEAPGTPETAALPEYFPGICIKDALIKVGGDCVFLRNILIKFASRNADAINRIKHALIENDSGTAIRRVHTLKGLCGSLGAYTLMHAAEKLEMAIYEGGSALDDALSDAGIALDEVIDGLAVLQEAPSKQTLPDR